MLSRIQKILAQAGIASRRKCEDLIIEGRVKVNGKVAQIGDKAKDSDEILVDDVKIPNKERHVYIILNKPKGVVTTVSEQFGNKTVIDIIDIQKRIYPVGRLDKNSEGLLLLTNDGNLTQKLLHPSMGVYKTYRVKLGTHFLPEDSKKMKQGVKVDNRVVKVRKFRRVTKGVVDIEIHEGRKHIVRKLFRELGYKVYKLTRLTFGPLELRQLKPGEWRYLTKKERDLLL